MAFSASPPQLMLHVARPSLQSTMECIWHEHLEQRLKYERNLNFSTIPGSDDDYCAKKKVTRDPMSHRIIEKRRRDRMNNCLADLSRLIPSSYLKKGRGRIEKTEIIEMAIRHLKQLQIHQFPDNSSAENNCGRGMSCRNVQQQPDAEATVEQYRLGFQECLSETMRFLVEFEGFYPGDALCVKLMSHLQKHCDKVVKGRRHNEFGGFESKIGSVTRRETSCTAKRLSPQPPSQLSQDASCTAKIRPAPTDDRIVPARRGKKRVREVGVEDPTGSQLREMLQNPSLSTVQRGRSMSASSSRPVSTASCSSGSSSRGGDEVYKFKRNIKERFKADQQEREVATAGVDTMSDGENSNADMAEHDQASPGPVPLCRLTPSPPTVLPDDDQETKYSAILKQKAPFVQLVDSPLEGVRDECVAVTSPARSCGSFNGLQQATRENSPREVRLKCHQNQPDVPIFALHPKGGFYVPMIVDASVILPYMSEVNEVADGVAAVLHHVGIAVYFYSGTTKIPCVQRMLQETSP